MDPGIPKHLDFGSAQVHGKPSAPLVLTYSFTALQVTQVSLVYGQDFSLSTPVCTSGGSCSVSLSFVPICPGLRQDAAIVTDQEGNWLGTTLLHGIGLGPKTAIYPGIISTYAAHFSKPSGIAVDMFGNLYIADSLNQVVLKVAFNSGSISTVAGVSFPAGYSGDGGPAIEAQLNNPSAVALDGGGNLYIADQGNDVIRKVNARTGVISTVAGGGRDQSGPDGMGDGGPATNAILAAPRDLAIDASGNLFIADTGHNLIRRVDATSGIISVVAGSGIARGADGFGGGAPATQVQLSNPTGVAVDTVGNLYIADTGNALVRFVDAKSGRIRTIAGTGNAAYDGDLGPAVSASLRNPTAVKVDAAGDVYIVDSGNNAIREVESATGIIKTVAGDGTNGYGGDGGVSTLARLGSPGGLAVDFFGNLYIADADNNVIRTVAVQPHPLDFGRATVGQGGTIQSIVVENIGNMPLNLQSIEVSANFEQRQSGYTDCLGGSSLGVGASCSIGVAFVPSAAVPLTGILALKTGASDGSGSVPVATLTGTGSPTAAPKTSFNTSSLVFPGRRTGDSGSSQIVTLSNAGSAPLAIWTISVIGANSDDFAINTTCSAIVASGASCSVSVAFTPHGTGPRSASLLFVDSEADSPRIIALSGRGFGI
jgi:sugar lactone lactonase YvrE